MSHGLINCDYLCQPKFDDVPLTAEFARGNAKQSMEVFNYKIQLPAVGGGRVLKGKHQLQKDVRRSDCVKLNKRSDSIHIRATASVIHDVRSKILICTYFLLDFCYFQFQWLLMELVDMKRYPELHCNG